MKWVTCHQGTLTIRESQHSPPLAPPHPPPHTPSNFPPPDTNPGPQLEPGTINELLFDTRAWGGEPSGRARPATPPVGSVLPPVGSVLPPVGPALAWATGNTATTNTADRVVIYCDDRHTLYPPGVRIRQLYLLRPPPGELLWTVAECLRCPGVSAVVAACPTRLSRVQARRLQLSAERGGTVGILLRPRGRGDDVYAASTRWLVSPAPPDPKHRHRQQWTLTLLHGHGRQTGTTFVLECGRGIHTHREPKLVPVPLPARVVHHPAIATVLQGQAHRRTG